MKKILAMLLALAMLLGFSACGSEEPAGWFTEGEITVTQKQVQKIVNGKFKTPKNVIVIIGDGMGANDITLAEEYAEGVYDFGLVLNQIPHHGLATTHSADSEVTDSAAAGTALSTGEKTNNGYVGKDVNGNDLKTMAEHAREAGKKVGIITDEDLAGATPTAFTVHSMSRNNLSGLINSMIQFTPDVLMARDYIRVFTMLDEESRKICDEEYLVAQNFKVFKETLDTDPESQKPFLGFFGGYSDKATYDLAQCTQVALRRLKNENGFFLMVESAGTDKFGHNNQMGGKLASVVNLDRTVAAVLQFMKQNPDTLLIVTSDHETGGVRLPEAGEGIDDLFTATDHTAAPVRVFALGQGAEYFHGKTVDNTDIAKFAIKVIKGE